jgi:hypothetical protein
MAVGSGISVWNVIQILVISLLFTFFLVDLNVSIVEMIIIQEGVACSEMQGKADYRWELEIDRCDVTR